MRELCPCFYPGSIGSVELWQPQEATKQRQAAGTSRDERFVSITLDSLRHSDTIQRTVNVQTITPKTRLMNKGG
jgi:hypothetical protein